jgi:AraC-like DNA-binding protein
MALGEISFLLGFSSPEAFQRAFKRWTGAAPGSYRKAIFAENKAEEYLKQ